jgi:2'-5' RNA ligase
LTILPPRPLSVPAEEAIAELREAASKFQPFEVGMGAVGLFESTGVVKLSVARGLNELRTLHEVLNTGSLKLVEPYKYTPHVTLCMDVEGRSPDELMAAAGPRWSAYDGEAGFIADRLTFVQQRADETWVDLVEVAVGEPKPIAVRR